MDRLPVVGVPNAPFPALAPAAMTRYLPIRSVHNHRADIGREIGADRIGGASIAARHGDGVDPVAVQPSELRGAGARSARTRTRRQNTLTLTPNSTHS